MPVLFTEEIISTSETQISLQTLIEIIWLQRETNVVFPTLFKLESFVSIKSDGSKRLFLSRKHMCNHEPILHSMHYWLCMMGLIHKQCEFNELNFKSSLWGKQLNGTDKRPDSTTSWQEIKPPLRSKMSAHLRSQHQAWILHSRVRNDNRAADKVTGNWVCLLLMSLFPLSKHFVCRRRALAENNEP